MDNPDEVAFSFRLFKKSPEIAIDDLIEIIKLKQTDSISVQILNPSWIISEKHLQVAIYHTLKAFRNKTNIARAKETEILIRISGLRQIKKAVEAFGIDGQTDTFLLVACGGTFLEMEEKVKQILSEAGLISTDNLSLPITTNEDLYKYYEIEKKSESLERKVLEKIATVELA